MSNDKNKKKELARILAGRMAGNVGQIDAVRSVKGQIKGFFTDDTLSKLRRAVADHESAGEEGAEARLQIILGLCDSYAERHGQETDDRAREKVSLVEDIKARAMVEGNRRQAEAIYVEDVYAGARKGEPSDTPFKRETTGAQSTAAHQTQRLFKGQLDKKPKEGFNQATLDLIKKYGLTEAEVLAVKVYTADDYKYINPVRSQDESRLRTYMGLTPKPGQPAPKPADDDSDDSETSSLLEGDLDLAQKLGVSDLSGDIEITPEDEKRLAEILGIELAPANDKGKEADTKGKTWPKGQVLEGKGKEPEDDKGKEAEDDKGKEPEDDKGKEAEKRITEPEDYLATKKGRGHLKQLLEEGSLHGSLAVAALSKLPAMKGMCYRGMRLTEEQYGESYGDPLNIKPETLHHLTSISTDRKVAQTFADGNADNNKTVSVLTCVKVKNGRDIGDISVHGRKENEWLLLPGTVLEVESVDVKKEKGNTGNPAATKWVVITAREV